jgi:hypothetical protein
LNPAKVTLPAPEIAPLRVNGTALVPPLPTTEGALMVTVVPLLPTVIGALTTALTTSGRSVVPPAIVIALVLVRADTLARVSVPLSMMVAPV